MPTLQHIIEYISAMEAVLVLKPQPGDGSPEIAWGDVFFYYAPDGVVPKSQPFATIVTKDYPGDETSQLHRPGAFRLNIAAGAAEFRTRTGHEPKDSAPHPASVSDVIIPHPVYGHLGWLAVVNPGPNTSTAIEELLQTAHRLARDRFRRHQTLRR